jgi:hypothetical protein
MQTELLAWFESVAAFAGAHPLAVWVGAGSTALLLALAIWRAAVRPSRKQAAGEPAAAPPIAVPAAVPAPARLRDRLRRTSDALVGRLSRLVEGRRLDAALLGELELLLFGADLGVKTAESLLPACVQRPRVRIRTRCVACCARRSSRSCGASKRRPVSRSAESLT